MAGIPYLIDECVDVEVGKFLLKRGHLETRFVARIDALQGKADAQIAAVAERQGWVIVSTNAKDYRRFVTGQKPRNPHLSLVTFKCEDIKCVSRIKATIDHVEYQHEYATARGHRYIVNVGKTQVVLWSEKRPKR